MLELKTALRILARRPGFSLVVVMIFAAGIAANIAVFSIYNGLFLRAFPFQQPERLVYLNESAPSRNMRDVLLSYEDLESLRTGTGAFESIAGFKDGDGAYFSGVGETTRVKVASITYNFAATLGIRPILGRDFLPEEDRKDQGRVVLLKYEFWKRQFQGRTDVAGTIVQLDGRAFTIVGVLPETAVFPGAADIWMPLGPYFPGEHLHFLGAVGRLNPGVALDQARADLMRLHKSLIPTRPSNQVTQPELMPLREHYLGSYRPLARVILGAVVVVLLIVCVNIAGLMLARGTARSRELAIRQALGAGRRHLIQQLLSESVLLAVAGGIAGASLGWIVLRALLLAMPDLLPSWVDFRIDARIVVFALMATAATGVLAGLFPAIQSSNIAVRGFLVDATPKATLSGARRGAMSSLVICELAAAMVLLAAGGLVLKAFRHVMSTDPGFRAASVLTFSLDLPYGYPPDAPRVAGFYEDLLDRVRALPGVESAGAVGVYGLPLSGFDFKTGIIIDGMNPPAGPGQPAPQVVQRFITPGYLETMGIALRAGRQMEQREDTPAVIVDEEFVRAFWPGDFDVIGRRIARPGRDPRWMTVVGVARDLRDDGLDRAPGPVIYVPYRELVQNQMSIVVRSGISAESQFHAVREIVSKMDPGVSVFDAHRMQDLVDRSLWLRRAYSWLFALLAGFGLVLSLAGVYGVVSYAVTQRTREIGIRMALGAKPRDLLAQILREGMVHVGLGVTIGLLVAGFATRLLQSLLAGVDSNDPWVYAAAGLLLGSAALAANAIPARRAASVNPVEALRSDG